MNIPNYEALSPEGKLTVNSLVSARYQFADHIRGSTHEGERDLYRIFGYEVNPGYSDFRDKYDRQDIASRICSAYPNAVWCHPPKVSEGDESDEETPFEKEFTDKCQALNLWHYINRLDTLCQLGEYAVLLIGIGDGEEDLSQPAGKGDPTYLMPFSEGNAIIKATESDASNPRFGQPTLYDLQMQSEEIDASNSTLTVHHSRVIHIADRTLDSDIRGSSILKPIFNRLVDLEKVVGGSSESFWMNSRGGLSLNADKDVEIANPEALTEEVQAFMNQMTRFIKTKGIDVKAINHTIARPDHHVSVCLELISGATGIPKRILVGSESGELSSNKDENNWNNRVDERRVNFCEPMILSKIVEKFSDLGFLKPPANFSFVWPCLDTQPPMEKADVALKTSQAIVAYANSPTSESLVTPEQFMTEVMDMEYRQDDLEELARQEEEEMEEERKAQAEELALNPPALPPVDPNSSELE